MSETTNKLPPCVKLSSGFLMPLMGLGTFGMNKTKCENAVSQAIDMGYRHIDTALLYSNESNIGKVLQQKFREGVVKREDIFLVTKLWNTFHEIDKVKYICSKQMEQLNVSYIDLYLMHYPISYKYITDSDVIPYKNDLLQMNDIDYLDTYKAMEELVELGWVRSIGLSNFNSVQIQRILDNCSIKPVTNQVECHPLLNQRKLINFCHQNDIIVTAYSPLGRPKPSKPLPIYYKSVKIQLIAQKYNKTVAQIVLRYLVDIGTVPIPKSCNVGRLAENLNIFDFKLTQDEIDVMDKFHTGERIWLCNIAKDHKYWPFGIEF